MSNSSNSNNSKTKYEMIYNFYGICNGIFPLKENKNNLLEKKRKTSDLIEEIDENDPKKGNTNDGINITKKNLKAKMNYYEKEIKLNEIEETENKNEIIEEINLEENDKIEDISPHDGIGKDNLIQN